MNTKICTRCKQQQKLDDFYKRKSSKDGHQSECKQCHKQRVEKYNKDNQETKRKYNKTYREKNRKQEAARCKLWRETNLEKIREYKKTNREKERQRSREYYVKHKENIKKYQNDYNKKNYEKQRAHDIAQKALLRNEILQTPCIVCGVSKNLVKHHPDYSQPKEIEWLCQSCHMKLHSEYKPL